MRLWPFRGRREVRQTFTDATVAAIVAAASGTRKNELSATVEAAARLWEFAFSAGRSTVLTPGQLAMLGRSLLLRGEAVFHRQRSRFAAVSSWDVQGSSANPDAWRYRLTVPTPETQRTINSAAGSVLHVRIGCAPERPWQGVSPLANAGATRDLLTAAEASLTAEHGGPVGTLIPAPNPGESGDLAQSIGGLAGKALLVEASEMDLPGEGQASRQTWMPKRLGPEPAEGSARTRADVERSLLAAAGVPIELVQPATGSDAREAWRRFLWATIAPAGHLVASELRRMGLDSRIEFQELNASDLAGRSRAYKQLREAQVPEAEARRICGFEAA